MTALPIDHLETSLPDSTTRIRTLGRKYLVIGHPFGYKDRPCVIAALKAFSFSMRLFGRLEYCVALPPEGNSGMPANLRDHHCRRTRESEHGGWWIHCH